MLDTCFFYDGYYEIPGAALSARLVDFFDEKVYNLKWHL